MPNFIELDGQRFDFHDAALQLYHCASTEADWNLRLTRADGNSRVTWLGGTVGPSPARAEDLHERALVIESEDLDMLFGELLGEPLTTYPNGQDVCRAHFVGEWSDEGLELISGFEYDWDREPGQEELPLRHARLEFRVVVEALHPGALPPT